MPLPFDFWMWAICLAFGAFCVWNAARITQSLGKTASKDIDGKDGDALDIHLGSWFKIATRSPAVAFFTLAIVAGIGLPAFYSYLYAPPPAGRGSKLVTVHGSFQPTIAGVCFQTTATQQFSANTYTLKFPRDISQIDYTAEAPNALPHTLDIELNGSSATYWIDNTKISAALDPEGSLDINDPIIFTSASQGVANLPKQAAVGNQQVPLSQALAGQKE